MPVLHNLATGQDELVPDSALQRARESGNYVIPDDLKQAVVTPSGRTVEATASAVEAAGSANIQPASETQRGAAEQSAFLEAEHGGLGSEVGTFVEGVLDAGTAGLYGVAARNLAPEYNENRRERAEVNPVARVAGQATGLIGGALTGVGAGGLAAKAGTATTARLGGGALATGVGMAAEGALLGVGETAQELALSKDPVTLERIVSSLGSNVLLGAGTGFVGGVSVKAAAKGLAKGRELAEGLAKRTAVADDLRHLDAAGLRAAKETEEAAISAQRTTAKVSVADEITELRQASKAAKTWLATEDKALRRVALKADRSLDVLTDNLKGLGQNPRRALDALQKSEQVLAKIVDGGESLRTKIAAEAAETVGEEAAKVGQSRLAALDAAEKMLERNRALQSKIDDLYKPLASDRLTQIQQASDALASGGNKSFLGGLVDRGIQGAGMSAAAGILPGGPVGAIGMMIAPQVIGKLKDLITGRLVRAAGEAAARSSKAVDAFLTVGTKAARSAPVLASKTLREVSFGPEVKRSAPAVSAKNSTPLIKAYHARSAELLEQVVMAPDGSLVMKPQARAAMAASLAGVRALEPLLADKMETIAARRVEFLANKLPKRPDIAAMQIGPDRWQPSDMDVRTFARYVAAAEDPGGVEERLADGTVTPEDAEAYRAIYPDRFEDFRRQVIEQLPMLRESLPYSRKVALSILTGVPVDPAMHPQVLHVLQSMYTDEPETEGGTMAPAAQPQFGSISKPDPTTAQKRAG